MQNRDRTMSEKHPFPEEPKRGVDEERDAPLLADVEQRLKRVRPRPPKLDVEAIMRSAQTAEEPVELSRSPADFRQRRSRLWAAAIAGAWLCGAIAGAVATLVILGRAAPSEPQRGLVVVEQQPLPEGTEAGQEDVSDDHARDIESDDVQPMRRESWSSEESQLALALCDPYASWAASGDFGRPPLRAGVMKRGRVLPIGRRVGRGSGPAFPDVEDMQDSAERAPRSGVSSPVAEPAITREQLLQELLGASPDSVL
jgi:hypothetical protein